MSNVASLQKAAGATEAQIKSLKDAAEQFGATTQFSMSECADALGYMALAGWDAEKSISALPGVLNLSAASGMGLPSAYDGGIWTMNNKFYGFPYIRSSGIAPPYQGGFSDLYLGAKNVKNLHLGRMPVKRVYRGKELVFEKE